MNVFQKFRNGIMMGLNRNLMDDYDGRCGYCRCYYADGDTFCRYYGKKLGGGSFKPYVDDRDVHNAKMPVMRSHECPVCKKTWSNKLMHDYDCYCVVCGTRLIVKEYSDIEPTDMALTGLPALKKHLNYYLKDRSIWSPFALYTECEDYRFRILNGPHFLGRNSESDRFFGDKADSIARRQAALDSRESRLYIKSCGAINANKVNNVEVGEDWMEIKDGDRLTLAALTFTVSCEGYTD